MNDLPATVSVARPGRTVGRIDAPETGLDPPLFVIVNKDLTKAWRPPCDWLQDQSCMWLP
jgi:hypothetical protein